MKNVLIPLTGTEFSQKILPHVKSLFDPNTTTLTLFRVTTPPDEIPEAQEVDPAAGAEPLAMPYYPYGPRPLDLMGQPTQPESRDVKPTPHSGTVVNQHIQKLEEELMTVGRPLQQDGYEVHAAVSLSEEEETGKEIVRFADDEDVDVIAMATHAPSGLERLIADNVTGHVLRNTGKPMLVYRPEID